MKNINENKRDRFVRIAETRTNKILSMIKLLGNCSNRGVYDYNDEDISKIFNALEKETRIAKQRFINIEEKDGKFKLD